MIEPLYTFAELLVLPLTAHVGILAMTLLWMLVLRTAWRNNWIGLFWEQPAPSRRRAMAEKLLEKVI